MAKWAIDVWFSGVFRKQKAKGRTRKENNAFVTVNNGFGHSSCDLPKTFNGDFVTDENLWEITSLMTKLAIHGN